MSSSVSTRYKVLRCAGVAQPGALCALAGRTRPVHTLRVRKKSGTRRPLRNVAGSIPTTWAGSPVRNEAVVGGSSVDDWSVVASTVDGSSRRRSMIVASVDDWSVVASAVVVSSRRWSSHRWSAVVASVVSGRRIGGGWSVMDAGRSGVRGGGPGTAGKGERTSQKSTPVFWQATQSLGKRVGLEQAGRRSKSSPNATRAC